MSVGNPEKTLSIISRVSNMFQAKEKQFFIFFLIFNFLFLLNKIKITGWKDGHPSSPIVTIKLYKKNGWLFSHSANESNCLTQTDWNWVPYFLLFFFPVHLFCIFFFLHVCVCFYCAFALVMCCGYGFNISESLVYWV